MFGKKRRQHATADLSEQAMSDSLRAAQVIFQRHTESQASLSSGSTGAASPASSQSRTRKPSHGVGVSRPVPHGPFRSTPNVPRSAPTLVPSSGYSSQQLGRPVSPLPSESATAAAAMAHMALSRDSERQQEELLALSMLPQGLRSTPSSSTAKSIQTQDEPSGSNAVTRDKMPVAKSSAVSLPTRHAVMQPPPTSQPNGEIQTLPLKHPAQSTLSVNTSCSASSGHQYKLKRTESRTLVGRIPPPDIYLETNEDDEAFDEESEGRDEDARSINHQLSSSPNVSSSSALSFLTGGPSYMEDEEDLNSEEQDLMGSEIESFDVGSSNDIPRQTPSVSSLHTEPDDQKVSPTPVKTNASYGVLNRIGHGNVTYQGTLPDLIPNHARRTRIDRIRTKLFGAKSRSEVPNDVALSSVTADEEGRPVVTTNHNVRFKTTMRGHDRHSSNESSNAADQAGAQPNGAVSNNEGAMIDSEDDDTDSNDDRGNEKKRKRRTARLKRRLKHSAVPYTHHLHHHETRHHTNRKGFNEDKPWKSHKDVGFVTPPERKRYEGMWVSNRCLYLELLPWWASVISGQSAPPAKLPEDGLILNLVVKDIWARSNLPNDLLRQIYERVDTRGDGTLDRKSFIVGMWLVDQCLYGRKLPKEVGQQVWDSVDRYVVNVINSTAMKHLDKSKKKLMKQEIKNIKKDIKNVHL